MSWIDSRSGHDIVADKEEWNISSVDCMIRDILSICIVCDLTTIYRTQCWFYIQSEQASLLDWHAKNTKISKHQRKVDLVPQRLPLYKSAQAKYLDYISIFSVRISILRFPILLHCASNLELSLDGCTYHWVKTGRRRHLRVRKKAFFFAPHSHFIALSSWGTFRLEDW